MILLRTLAIILISGVLTPAFAQEDDFPQRLALAEKMLEIRPASAQLENAVDLYIRNFLFAAPEEEQQEFREAVLAVMNPKALEKISVDAYAETFTMVELEAMVEYFSKPEARSASDKQDLLNTRIAPEIARMLDQALIRLRTQPEN